MPARFTNFMRHGFLFIQMAQSPNSPLQAFWGLLLPETAGAAQHGSAVLSGFGSATLPKCTWNLRRESSKRSFCVKMLIILEGVPFKIEEKAALTPDQ